MNTDALLTNINRICKANEHDRLINELNFARRASLARNGAYGDIIYSALQKTYAHVSKHGFVCPDFVNEIESDLLPMSGLCKEYVWGLVGHAHIDMNWMWRYDETALVVLDTFRTMLRLTDEFPSFTFAQSQASTYEIVEKYEPEMLAEIKDRIRRGQWEVTATSWVEPDRNMPGLESEIRHILYTKRYISSLLGVPAESLNIDYEPDTFGHNARVPDLLSAAGIEYLYHCRGTDAHGLYRFRGESGKNIIAFRELDWYNRSISGALAARVPEFCEKSGVPMLLTTYGVGDHGGGPTRRDIRRAIDMADWPIFPTIKFATYSEFFKSAKLAGEKNDIFQGERNCMFTGCYSSQSCIKRANAQAERSLFKSEAFSAFACREVGSTYRKAAFEGAWRRVLFNHFHDILTGSGTPDTREYAMGEYQNAFAATATAQRGAFTAIADSIDTTAFAVSENDNGMSLGAGAGFGADKHVYNAFSNGSGNTRIFHIFNTLPWHREVNAEIVIWDYEGDMSLLRFVDASGNILPHALLSSGTDRYWGHHYITALVFASLPALGYTTVAAEQDNAPSALAISDSYTYGQEEHPLCMALDNGVIRAEFDSSTARLTRLVDLETGADCLTDAGFDIIDEDPSRGMTSWTIGRYMRVRSSHERVTVKAGAHSDLRKSFIMNMSMGERSKLECEISLDRGEKKLNYSVKCDWREVGSNEKLPQLSFSARMPKPADEFLYRLAGGEISRKGEEQDKPSHFAVCANGALLMCDSRYGFRGNRNEMRVALIRATIDPDKLPEQGLHEFNVGVSAFSGGERELYRKTEEYVSPPDFVSGIRHAGNLKASMSFVDMEKCDIRLSGVKMAEDAGEIVLHLYNPTNAESTGEIVFSADIKSADICDLLENKTGACPFDGRVLKPCLDAGEIAAVKVRFS